MKELKLQSDLLKMAYNRDYNFKANKLLFTLCDYEGMNYLVYSDEHALYLILERWLYIDVAKVFNTVPTKALKSIIDNSKNNNLVEITDTKTIKINDKRKLHIFKIENEEIYVDEKLLKYFDFDNDIKFYGANKKEPVYVFENTFLVGVVMPTIIL